MLVGAGVDSQGLRRLDVHANAFEVSDHGSMCEGLGLKLLTGTARGRNQLSRFPTIGLSDFIAGRSGA